MSRRVCETCAWFVTGEIDGVNGYGICSYRERRTPTPYLARQTVMYPIIAAQQIRREEDLCKNWERDDRESWEREEDEHE